MEHSDHAKMLVEALLTADSELLAIASKEKNILGTRLTELRKQTYLEIVTLWLHANK